jgi:hypothetical protein
MFRRRTTFFAAFALLIAVTGLQAVTCTPTGFFRDHINMTAAVVNPAATVTGDVNATGCNIGVYYDTGSGAVYHATIYGSNYFGIVVNGDYNAVTVDVTDSIVHDIGETPFNGTQHGVGIYYRALGVGSTSGTVSGNTVYNYQKGGIVANGATTLTASRNIVTGLGRVDFIAQNGIQLGYGASAIVQRNVVTGNAYTGINCASSGGILVVGGDCYGGALTVGTQISGNTAVNNDVGVYLSNLDATCSAPAIQTNIKVINNTLTNDALTNLGGCGYIGYQAGISDVGMNDKMINNTISGVGYTNPGNAVTFATPIDADPSFTNRPKVHANK